MQPKASSQQARPPEVCAPHIHALSLFSLTGVGLEGEGVVVGVVNLVHVAHEVVRHRAGGVVLRAQLQPGYEEQRNIGMRIAWSDGGGSKSVRARGGIEEGTSRQTSGISDKVVRPRLCVLRASAAHLEGGRLHDEDLVLHEAAEHGHVGGLLLEAVVTEGHAVQPAGRRRSGDGERERAE